MARGTTHNAIPSREEIIRYLRNEMPAAESDSFKKRIEADPFLKDAVEGLSLLHTEDAEGAIEDLCKNIDAVSSGRSSSKWWWTAVAASVLLLAGSVFFLRYNHLNEELAAGAGGESKVALLDDKRGEKQQEPANIVSESSEQGLTSESDLDAAPDNPVTSAEEQVGKDVSDKVFREPQPDKQSAAIPSPMPRVENENADNIEEVTVEENFRSLSAGSASVDYSATVDEMLAIAADHYGSGTPDVKSNVTLKSEVEKKKEKALKDCETCPAKLAETSSSINRNYAFAKYSEGNYKLAEKYFVLTLEEKPGDAESSFYYLLTLLHLGKTKEADNKLQNMETELGWEMSNWIKAGIWLSEGKSEMAEQNLASLKEASTHPLGKEAERLLQKIR